MEQYQSTAPSDEYGVIEELKEYVIEREDCFERKREEGARHIAAAVLLVTPYFHKALFLWHAKIQCWTQPGGHADGNPDLHAVALEELEEEIGVTDAKLASPVLLDIHRFDYAPEVFGYRKSIYNVCFIAILPEYQEPRIMEQEKLEAMRLGDAGRSPRHDTIKTARRHGKEYDLVFLKLAFAFVQNKKAFLKRIKKSFLHGLVIITPVIDDSSENPSEKIVNISVPRSEMDRLLGGVLWYL